MDGEQKLFSNIVRKSRLRTTLKRRFLKTLNLCPFNGDVEQIRISRNIMNQVLPVFWKRNACLLLETKNPLLTHCTINLTENAQRIYIPLLFKFVLNIGPNVTKIVNMFHIGVLEPNVVKSSHPW